MRLKNLRLKQFRQFRQELRLNDLQPGINLFYGPNESGKSTVALAIRAAFFERHGSGTLGHLQPWGESTAAPEVSVEFDWNGVTFQLSKRFLRQKRCRLQAGQQVYEGDEAEQHLAGLLGFDVPARGASKPEHWGIPGLLWIEQGAGQDFRDATLYAADHLQAALSQSAGQLASTEGDRVIREVQTRMDLFLTTATQVPSRDYAAAIKQAAAIQTDLEALDKTIAAYRKQVDHLAVLQAAHGKDETDLPWLALRKQEQAARQQLAQAQQLEQDGKRESDRLIACRETLTLLHDRLTTIQKQRQQLHERQLSSQKADDALQQAELSTASLQAAVEQAHSHLTALDAALLLARNAHVRQSKLDALQAAQTTLEELQRTASLARAVQQELQQQQTNAAQWRIDPEQLKRLQELHHQLAGLAERQNSAATRVLITLDEGKTLQLDGLPVQGSTELQLLKSTTILMPGLGHLQIVPGGQDLNVLVRQKQLAQTEFQALLTEMAVTDLSTALAKADYSTQLQTEISQNEARLAIYAPQGLQPLEAKVQQLEHSVASMQQALPPDTSKAVGAAQEVPLDIDAQAGLAAVRLKTAETVFHQHNATLATKRALAESARLEYQHVLAVVHQWDQQQHEQETLRQLNEQRALEQSLTERITDFQQRIAQVRPDILSQDIQRYAASARQLEQAHTERERQILMLFAELQAVGAQGLEEQRSSLAGQLALVQQRVDEFARKAQALKLLHGLLLTHRQVVTQRLQAPLQAHLHHYVQLLFPQSGLRVDENLVISHLDRTAAQGADATVAAVESLSFGAREQLGLISRLAYADLLSAAGKPTLIMLDDALVHSDPERLAAMKRILFDAAQRHQILLFTCHPDEWRDLGVVPRPLDSGSNLDSLGI